ncbi:proton-coupled amino acid transporter 2-like isoform X6 [Vespa velutina]|uniref:proton-coupled amino acid transporter 2-like isoform X6 n=1 Tax=Vespa velutina TaxID=202808 RepID=UPI001FB2274F|nr:proton-coupled amino acid transporter 2-like isoform X6 [Vespa velutina]
MELHSNPAVMSTKKNSIHGDETTFKESLGNGGTYGAFQSKDPILSMEKGGEMKGGVDEHGMTVDHPTSYIETMMHLFKGNVGSGIFALGDAFKHAGLLLAPPLTIFLGIICVHAQHILVLNAHNLKLSVHQHMAIVLIPIILSTWIRNLKYLVPVTSVANFLVMGGYIATVYIMSHDIPAISERRYVADWHELPLFFGTVIYSFEGITLVLPLKNEMKKPSNFNKPFGVLNVGMVIVGAMFVVMGFLSYLKYGDDVRGSVTLNLELTEVVDEKKIYSQASLPQCIKLAISLSILLTYALQFYVPIAIIWPGIVEQFGPFKWPVLSEIVFRSALCFLTFVLAEAIPELGLFISLVGAVSSTALALLFPPIIELVVCWQNANLSPFMVIKDVTIVLIGLLGFATGTYESITSIIKAFDK